MTATTATTFEEMKSVIENMTNIEQTSEMLAMIKRVEDKFYDRRNLMGLLSFKMTELQNA